MADESVDEDPVLAAAETSMENFGGEDIDAELNPTDNPVDDDPTLMPPPSDQPDEGELDPLVEEKFQADPSDPVLTEVTEPTVPTEP